jgi:hypothetical protein
MLSDEEEGSGCGGPGRCLTAKGLEHKSPLDIPLFLASCAGHLGDRDRQGGAVYVGPPFEVEQTARRRDQIRSVKFQGVTSACTAIGAGGMAMRKVRMGS